jgi:hypothetical protein
MTIYTFLSNAHHIKVEVSDGRRLACWEIDQVNGCEVSPHRAQDAESHAGKITVCWTQQYGFM